MAIFHQHTKLIKRSKGQSSVGAAAYRAGCRLVDERTGKVYDYSKKNDVVYSEIFLTNDVPDVYRDRETLWNAVEASHARKDAQTARDILIALPHEFTPEQCKDAVADFVKTYCVAHGMIVDVNIHRDEDNKPHAHLLITKREATPDGFGKVARAWNTKAQLYAWRQGWESVLNLHLKRANIEQSVSCKSLSDLDIDLAGQNLSMAGFQANGQGRKLDEIEQYWYTVARNHDALMARPEIALQFLTQKKATFTQRDIEHVAFRYSENEAQYTALTERLLTCPELVRLGEKDHTMRFSSRELVNTEIDVFDDALALSATTTRQLSDKQLAKTLRHFEKKGGALRPDQETAFRYLTQDSGDYAALVGIAGAGKSYVLGAVAHAYHLDKRKVYGAALSAKIAGELGRDAKLDASRSVARWLGLWRYEEKQIQTGKRKPDDRFIKPGDVLMIDEANLLGGRQMQQFTRYCRNQGVALMTIGDDGQAQSIEASGIFGGLAERLGAAELSRPIRQKIDWQRECTTDFFKGNTERALTRYLAHDRIGLCDDEQTAITQLLDVWENERFANKKSVPGQLLLASTNAMVETLNTEARKRLQACGALPADSVHLMTSRGERDFASGDEVLFLKNDSTYQSSLTYRKGQKIGVVENGQRGIISGSTRKGELIITTVDNDNVADGREVLLDAARYNAIDHGYAMTTIKAEGVTYDNAYLYASSNMNANQLYVAASRHRLNFYGVINSADFMPEADTLLPDNHAAPAPASRIDERIIRRLSRQHKQEIAIDYLLKGKIRTPEQRVADFRAYQDARLRRELAFVVHTDFAAHIDFVKSQSEYDAIIDLSRDYERTLLLSNATPDEREALLRVERYRQEKTVTGECWQRFFKAIEVNAAPDTLAPLAKAAREAQASRNATAATIMDDLELHRVALYHYQMADSVAESSLSTETVNRYHASVDAAPDKQGEIALRFFDFLREQTIYTGKQAPFATTEQKDEWQQLVTASRKTALATLRQRSNSAEQDAALAGVEAALTKSVAQPYAAHVFFKAVVDNHRNGHHILRVLHITPDDIMDEASLGRYCQAKRAASEHTYLSYERQAFTRLSQHAAQRDSKRTVAEYADALSPHRKVTLAYTLARYPSTYKRALAAHFRGIEDEKTRKEARFAFYRDAAIGQCRTMLAAAPSTEKPIVTAIISAVEAHYTDRAALLGQLQALKVNDEKVVSRYLSRLSLNLDAANFAMAYTEALQDDDANAIAVRAFVMAAQSKTYYGFFDKTEWRNICAFAKTHERQLLLANATDDEAAVITLVNTYREATQAVALHVTTSKEQKNGVSHSIDGEWVGDIFSTPHGSTTNGTATVDKKAAFAKTKTLCAERDALAYAVLQAGDIKNIPLMLHDIIENPLAEANTPDAWAHTRYCKVVEHASRYHAQLAALPDYLNKRNGLLTEAQAWQQKGTLTAKLADKDDFDMPYWLRDWNGLQKQREQLLPLLQHDTTLAAMATIVTADMQLSDTLTTWEKAQTSDVRNAPPEIDNAYANDLWKQSAPISGTLAETYLQDKRGITDIATAVGEDVRFLPRAWHSELKGSFPALVVFSRDSHGTVQAGQRIYLDPNTGDKIAMNDVARDNQKRTFGSISKYPARVSQTPDKPTIIALAEGPETALSISEAHPDWDTFAVLGANNFVHFPRAPTPNQPLLLCLDHDDKDRYTRKMQTASIALTAKGYDVTAVQPETVKQDFNDVRIEAGIKGVQQALSNVVDLHASIDTLFEAEFSLQPDAEQFVQSWQAPKAVTPVTGVPIPVEPILDSMDNSAPNAMDEDTPVPSDYDEYSQHIGNNIPTQQPPITKEPKAIDLLTNIPAFDNWFESIDWDAIEGESEKPYFKSIIRRKSNFVWARDDKKPDLTLQTRLRKELMEGFNEIINDEEKRNTLTLLKCPARVVDTFKGQHTVVETIAQQHKRTHEQSRGFDF